MTTVGSIETNLDKLVEEKTDGKSASFSEFYRSHQLYIRNMLFRIGIRDELDDAVQITFVKAWTKLDKFEKRASVKTWLTRIAVNVAYERFRKLKPAPPTPPRQLQRTENRVENQQLVSRALESLTIEHRLVVVLCLIEGHSLEEVSEITGHPVGTIKSRLHRARTTLQKTLKELGLEL
ncbi:RNA polymerase sigma factor [Oligoflexaceae bacterium]|nr:RNA polymerase sigma factor [Oligoflexaceae bacterium]